MHSARPLHPTDFKPQHVSGSEAGEQRLSSPWSRVRAITSSFARRAFTIDLRSLAAFRIALSMLLLWDLAVAMSNVRAFYSDNGVLTREEVFSTGFWASNAWWSVHMMSGSAWFQGALFLVGAAVALMLLVGWRTRLATFVSWVLVCSMQARNPAILHGGDDITRVLLFWACFLPLGAKWSVDARLSRSRTPLSNALATFPGACLLLQVAIVYLFSMILKTDPMWHPGGTGLRVALQMDHFVKPFGMWVREQDSLCRILTTMTGLVEFGAAWLAFIPFRNAFFRLIAVATFWSFHAGIWLCMDVGPFCLIMAAAWLPFLPAVVWERLGKMGQGIVVRFPRVKSTALHAAARALIVFRRKLDPFFHRRSKADYGLRPSVSALLLTGCCLVYSLCWNIRDTDAKKFEPYFPNSVNWLGHAMRWEQFWGMFSPRPVMDSGWYVSVAKLADGKEVDLLRHGTPVDWAKPPVVSEVFWDSRWQKYMANLWIGKFECCRLPMLRYLTQSWNESHGPLEQVYQLKLWYVIQYTNDDGTLQKRTKTVEMAKYIPPS